MEESEQLGLNTLSPLHLSLYLCARSVCAGGELHGACTDNKYSCNVSAICFLLTVLSLAVYAYLPVLRTSSLCCIWAVPRYAPRRTKILCANRCFCFIFAHEMCVLSWCVCLCAFKVASLISQGRHALLARKRHRGEDDLFSVAECGYFSALSLCCRGPASGEDQGHPVGVRHTAHTHKMSSRMEEGGRTSTHSLLSTLCLMWALAATRPSKW